MNVAQWQVAEIDRVHRRAKYLGKTCDGSSAVGQGTTEIFHDNTKAWSGDHCIDPRQIPGVLFCNRSIDSEHPRLLDLGPTVLDLFGVDTPEHMDGRPLAVGETA